ncbi:MAG: T9SS type A sorting domain-containing protein [Bacteroidota bacterium]
MKKIIYILTAVFLQCTAFGQKQTIISVADGPWLTPTTWDCSCIPIPGSIIEINHDVIFNTNFAYTSGSITINSGASLSKDVSIRSLGMAGGSLENDGTLELDRLGTTAGTITNSNTMIINQSFYNGGNFTNDGLVEQLDSLQNNGTINNNSNGRIETTNLWNNATLNNDGHLEMTYFLNSLNYSGSGIISTSHFLNTGTAITQDSVLISDDFMNTGNLHNTTNVPFLVIHDFLNCDSTYHDAVFTNDGFVHIGNNFTNVDTLKGTEGSFCIADSSLNTGYIKGSVDICDLTSSGPLYIDLNTGVIGANVTSCTHSCGVGINEENSLQENVEVYPNPYSSSTTFTFHSTLPDGASLTVFDLTGNAIIIKYFGNDGIITISDELSAGLYFYLIKNTEGKIYSGKLISL